MKFLHYILGFAIVLLIIAIFVLLPPPPVTTQFSNVELAGNSPVVGDVGAKVTIVEFSDYQCPACLAAEQSVEEMLKIYGSNIRFVYRNFPLYQIHPQAEISAEAAMSALEQGKFWEMHHELFANQELVSQGGVIALKQLAKEIGLDENKFNSDLDSRIFSVVVKKDLDDGLRFTVDRTPTFFINGKKVAGALSLDTWKQLIDAELAK